MAARFVDVSESEIGQFKENAVPQKKKPQIINGVLLKQLVASGDVNIGSRWLFADIHVAFGD